MFEKLPEDMIVYVLSYLDNDVIKKIDIPYECYKKYVYLRTNNDNSQDWYRGIYYNLYNKCFICKGPFDVLYITIICYNCELLLDDYFSYPTICTRCSNFKGLTRGKIFSRKCPGCNNSRMNLAITSYS